jgi:hypothetical protein
MRYRIIDSAVALIGLVAALFVLVASASDAGAQTRSHHFNAAQGRDTRIRWFSTSDRQCRQQGFPVYTILSPPAHGKLSFREEWGAINMPRAEVPHLAPQCRGKPILGKAIYYRPDPGYRGSDRVRVQTYFPPRDLTIVDVIDISVR